jgi:hypothetical protein
LEGILFNLVARARDAMPDGGVVTIETNSLRARAALTNRLRNPVGMSASP